MEEIITRLRRPNSKPSPRGVRNVAVLPEDYWREVFRFSGQTCRLRPARHIFFNYVGGWYYEGFEVSELVDGRGEIALWSVNGYLELEPIHYFLTFLEDHRVDLHS